MEAIFRRLGRLSVLVAAATLVVVGTAVAAGTAGSNDGKQGGKAQNVILLIGDGMGTTHIDAARARYYGADGHLNMEKLPVSGTVRTYSVVERSAKPDYVTDSASAGTAWASGVKTYNAAIGKDAYGRDVPTILELAKQAGVRTGNVSTAEVTDATPAVLFSHVKNRGCQGPYSTQASSTTCAGDTPIARQIATNNVADVILGGGLARFEPQDEATLEANGYTVLGGFGSGPNPQSATTQQVATKAELNSVSGKNRRVIGLFNRGNLTIEKYKQDNPASFQAQNEPTLAELTTKAIQLLADSDDARKRGFFLQVEGALIDKRSHANDAAQTLGEMKAFDDAVAAAMAYAAHDKNTLVIVTADHECAGFNIIGKGSFTNAEAANPPHNVDSGNTANNSAPTRASGNVLDPSRSTGPINGAGAGNSHNFAPATFRTADDPADVQDGDPRASLWLGYLSGNHTGADVQLFASGPGSGAFEGNMDNTEIFSKMRDALVALEGKR